MKCIRSAALASLISVICLALSTLAYSQVLVDQEPTHAIAAWHKYTWPSGLRDDWVVLMRDGTMWVLEYGTQWGRYTATPVPVPVSDIQYWELEKFITFDGRVYTWDFDAKSYSFQIQLPPEVSTQSTSWGDIKTKFK